LEKEARARKAKEGESMLVQTSLHSQNKGNQWYVDSGCSSHMTGDKSKFLTLKEVNEGIVTFGDNAKVTVGAPVAARNTRKTPCNAMC
jgi:hypothetical protein